MKTKDPFAIIGKPETMNTGENMGNKINVLDINIDKCSAKEAMKKAMEYIDSQAVSIIEMVTTDSVMQMDDVPGIKEEVKSFDLILPGEISILEAAGVTEKKYMQETEKNIFLKMFLRYIHKHHKRVYLLVEAEEEVQDFYEYVEKHYSGIEIAGMAKVSAENRADDMIVNAINGGEVDCVLSILSSPLQEEFIIRNKTLLNLRVWVGLGKHILPVCKSRPGRFTQFIMKRILKKEIEKRKRG